MPIFISLSDPERKKFFKELKIKIDSSWDTFYPKYKISRSMFFNYLSGRYDLPKGLFTEWKNIVGNSNFPFIEQEKLKHIEKTIINVKFDGEMSEILGILNGDGHISNYKHEVCIVGDLKEGDYFNYLKNLFEKKFGTVFTLRKEKSAFKLRCYSKGISEILSSEYLLPKGNKMGRLKIPKQVLKSDIFLKHYIRGLYDTDGSFYLRRKKDPVVQITSADPSFLAEVRNCLIKLGFQASKGNQRVFIYGENNVKRFFEDIKPANSKHLKKYKSYLNNPRG